jgi:hypothetical protein
VTRKTCTFISKQKKKNQLGESLVQLEEVVHFYFCFKRQLDQTKEKFGPCSTFELSKDKEQKKDSLLIEFEDATAPEPSITIEGMIESDGLDEIEPTFIIEMEPEEQHDEGGNSEKVDKFNQLSQLTE